MEGNKDLKSVLISEKEIEKIIEDMAASLNHDMCGKDVVIVLVLKGSVVFCADLMRKLTFPVTLDVMKVSSYRDTTVSGELSVELDLASDISGRDVLIVEDIIDSGNTLFALKNMLGSRGAKSVSICTFLDKPDRRMADVKADYIGKSIPDEFVVGYGLDYNERYRELPYVGVLGEWVYA